MATTGYGVSPIFAYVKFVDIGKSITNFRTAGNVMPYHFFPTALLVAVSWLMPPFGGISPITCTIFDPIIFLRNSVSTFFHIFLTRVNFSSAGKGDDKPSKQGNRRLQGTIYFLAIQMIQLSSKGLPRNPAFYAYYQRQLARGKTKPQALILISRRLISIIYGMLKNKTEYVMPKVQDNYD